jgi:transposase-like protein
MSPSEKLTPRKRKAVFHLVQGKTVVDVSSELGISERQVFRWLKEPAFRNELNSLQLNGMEEVSRKLVHLASTAVDTLEDVNQNPTQKGAGIRVRLSLGVLDCIGKWNEMVDVSTRLTELERKVFNGKK